MTAVGRPRWLTEICFDLAGHWLSDRIPVRMLLAGRDDAGHGMLWQTGDTARSMTLHQTTNLEGSITAGTSLKTP